MKLRLLYLVTGGLLSLVTTTGQASETSSWIDPVSGIEFVRVPAGCFEMGEGKVGLIGLGLQLPTPAANELPVHRVCVGELWVGRTEVTRRQWQNVMSGEVSVVAGPNEPVTNISWHDAKKFGAAMTLAERDGVSRRTFRLPTEAEWEYICQAGDKRPVIDLLDVVGEPAEALERWTKERAWYASEPAIRDQALSDVGKLRANAWGLYDTLGNALEWVEDSYVANAYSQHAENNPKLVDAGAPKVARGGSYRSPLSRARCGARFFAPAEDYTPVIGLRVIMNLR